MKTFHRNPPRNDTPTSKQRRLLTTVRLATVCGKLLVPLLLGASLGIPLSNEAGAQELDTSVTTANHDPKAAMVVDGGTIETHLERPVDEQGRPAPPCKQCEATTKKLTTSTGTTSGARVEFTFRSENGTPYTGAIKIEVHQPNSDPLVVHEDFVTVLDGQTIPVELDNDEMCNFEQVDRVTYWLLTPQMQ